MNVYAFIFARGGSKGVPRKNLRPLGGMPLIAHSIRTALECPRIGRVIVSTDDPEIAVVAREYGAEVPFLRPPELAADDAPERLAWQHAIREITARPEYPPIDLFVSLPPTSPLRSVEDVEACIDLALSSDADTVLAVTEAHRNPQFNMVFLDGDATARLVLPPDRQVSRRQDAPRAYDVTTVAYASRPEFILRTASYLDGKVKAIIVPAERAIDIDTELDFEIAALLFRRAQRARERAA